MTIPGENPDLRRKRWLALNDQTGQVEQIIMSDWRMYYGAAIVSVVIAALMITAFIAILV